MLLISQHLNRGITHYDPLKFNLFNVMELARGLECLPRCVRSPKDFLQVPRLERAVACFLAHV